jgi:hypothetical protein
MEAVRSTEMLINSCYNTPLHVSEGGTLNKLKMFEKKVLKRAKMEGGENYIMKSLIIFALSPNIILVITSTEIRWADMYNTHGRDGLSEHQLASQEKVCSMDLLLYLFVSVCFLAFDGDRSIGIVRLRTKTMEFFSPLF